MNLTKEQIEKIKTGVIIVLGILVFFGATYFISEMWEIVVKIKKL